MVRGKHLARCPAVAVSGTRCFFLQPLFSLFLDKEILPRGNCVVGAEKLSEEW